MTITKLHDKDTIYAIVRQACAYEARRWRQLPDEGMGYVCVKILERLNRVDHLRKPLEHYARATAFKEAYRFYRGKAKWRHHHKED